jgi:uncharacterized protein YkwD
VLLAALAIAGGLVFALGRSGGSPEGEALPDSPVGMVNAGDDVSVAPAESTSTTRPVLAVTDPSSAADPASPATADVAPTTSVVDLSTSSSAAGAGTESTSTTVATSSSVSSTTMTGDGSSTTVTTDPNSTSTSAGDDGLTEVEQEIARLTNELRTNPNGPLRREGPAINCDGRLNVDPTTGAYAPVPAVTVDTVASVQVARPWSAQMTTDLAHRPEAGIPALVEAGIQVATAGENIAYHNFPDTAFRHFAGWRESDGHFCNLMDPGFTHLGIGEVTQADGFSYATQNFFSLPPAG